MIAIEDIEDMSDLTRAEIEALAEEMHSNLFDAAVMGDYLMHVHHGPHRVHEMICEDIRAALHKDDLPHARKLFAVLRKFLADHPEAVRGGTSGL